MARLHPLNSLYMFKSFFPNPRLFFWSAALWSLFAVLFWFFVARDAGHVIGLPNPPGDAEPVIGFTVFLTAPYIWFYLYYLTVVLIFAGVWWKLSPHPWFRWSVLGSALVVFLTYTSVEIDVAINAWYGPFYDLIAKACTTPKSVTPSELYLGLLAFAGLVAVWAPIGAFTSFFVRHYVFRWREAMHNFYAENWDRLSHIEGASQRVQDDTMQFARGMQNQGVSILNAVLTLIAFLPILYGYSQHITELPLIGYVPQALVWASIAWAIFGTGFLALLGIKLPGLEFNNQRVEAALRKELVLGEDDKTRASLPSITTLFTDVRKNYFRLFKNYFLFDFGKSVYLNADVVYSVILLIPSIAAGTISFGLFTQISNAFDRVRGAVQVLVSDWDSIVRLISIYKRLRAFEATLDAGVLPSTKAG
jgi:peptide/bleomycin uptake transporter